LSVNPDGQLSSGRFRSGPRSLAGICRMSVPVSDIRNGTPGTPGTPQRAKCTNGLPWDLDPSLLEHLEQVVLDRHAFPCRLRLETPVGHRRHVHCEPDLLTSQRLRRRRRDRRPPRAELELVAWLRHGWFLSHAAAFRPRRAT